jgi:hypothetical protein
MRPPPPPLPPPAPKQEAATAFTLSQSKIKKLNADNLCPLRFYEVDLMEKYESIPTVSMMRGQLFEYLALGSLNREYQIPALPRTSRGKITAEEKRIIEQASEFKRLLPLYGMTILATCVPLTIEWSPGFWVNMLLDVVVHWDRSYDPDPENNTRSGIYVFDAKLTANVHSMHGDFCWGQPWAMNHLQAYMYAEGVQRTLVRKKTGKPYDIGFVYGVFDYSPKMNHKLVEIQRSTMDIGDMKRQIKLAREKLDEIAADGFVAIPEYDQCKTCPILDCKVRAKVPSVQVVR